MAAAATSKDGAQITAHERESLLDGRRGNECVVHRTSSDAELPHAGCRRTSPLFGEKSCTGKRILNGFMNDADGSSLGRGHPAEDRHRLEDGMPR